MGAEVRSRSFYVFHFGKAQYKACMAEEGVLESQ